MNAPTQTRDPLYGPRQAGLIRQDNTVEITLDVDGPLGKRGQKIRLDVAVDDVHDPVELPSYLAGYAVPNHRADEFSPVLPVAFEKGRLRNHSLDDAFKAVDDEVDPSAHVPEITFETSLVDYACKWHAISGFVGEHVQEQALPAATALNPRRATAKRCMRIISLGRERRCATYLGTNTNFASGQRLTLGAGYQWDDGALSDPIADIHRGIEASCQDVDAIIMPRKIGHVFMRHPLVKDYARSQLGGMKGLETAVQEMQKASKRNVNIDLPNLPTIKIVASRVRNTSTGLDWIWGNAVVGITVEDAQPTDGESISTCITPRLRGMAGVGYDVREVPLLHRGVKGGMLVVVSRCETIFASANNAGFHLASPLTSY